MEYNFYCDESCHLPNDNSPVMVLGGIWCPKEKTREINDRIREIKKKHSIGPEMKWVKVSGAKLEAYLDLINYFFDDDDLHFRVLVVDNKTAINHAAFNQTHDEWYYKMYFDMIKTVLNPSDRYHIYLDIKDTKSKTKVAKLQEVLSNSQYTISRRTISNIQVIRSNEVEIMQIVDILIGAVGYKMRGFSKSNAKMQLIRLIERRSGYRFERNALYREDKFNIFHLRLQEDTQRG